MNSAFLRRVNRPHRTKPIIIWDFDGTVIDESLNLCMKNALKLYSKISLA